MDNEHQASSSQELQTKPDAPFAHARLVVGVDGSTGSKVALDWALGESAVRHSLLEVISVIPRAVSRERHVGLLPGTVDESTVRDHFLETLRAAATTSPPVEVEIHIIEGDPAETLCERSEQADLLVVGTRGRGAIAGLVLGSVSASCAHHATTPTVIVPESSAGTVRNPLEVSGDRIVVGIDGSPISASVFSWSIAEAKLHGAPVEVITAWHPSDANEEMSVEMAMFPTLSRKDRARAEALELHLTELFHDHAQEIDAMDVDSYLLQGEAAAVLCERAKGARLLVVGRRGHRAFSEVFLGSVSGRCARQSSCPVVVLPARK